MGKPKFDGMPAFPITNGNKIYAGMLLRDYFAAKAMQVLCASIHYENMTDEQIAHASYKNADAMIAEREKNE